MERLTITDRGTFLVTTQGSTHLWTITDEGVSYVRNPDPEKRHHWSTAHLTWPRRLEVRDVQVWPKVGERFHTVLYSMDTPWHLSSEVRSIERIEE